MDTSEETAVDPDMIMESTDGEESSATATPHPQSNDGRVCDEIHDESVAMTTGPARQETAGDAMVTSPVHQETDNAMATSPVLQETDGAMTTSPVRQEMDVAIETCPASQVTDVTMEISPTSRVPEALDRRADDKVLLVPSESADTGEENSNNVCSVRTMNNDRQVPGSEIDECGVATASTNRAPDTATHRQARMAQQTWEMHNDVKLVKNVDDIYKYNASGQQNILNAKPWGHDPHFFRNIKISALALLKMVMHARSGGNLEIMGLLVGKVDGNTMIVMDAFALPVEGTETRVNAQTEAYEYMSAYMMSAKEVGRVENAIGWYHSHPGYGCWLSGIDVSTQMLNQQFQEPFVAIVVDPNRTISAGKVCIGAFRTYPKDYKPPNDDESSQYQTIPLSKVEDFGVHCKQYYSLEISYFKSSLDCRLLESLWNKYWVNTLSSSNLIANADYLTGQIYDLSEKLEQSDVQLQRAVCRMRGFEEKDPEDKLAKATKDCTKTTIEMLRGSMTQCLKHILFNKEN